MSATKRKRRGGLEVQARKPKKIRKDTGKPAKQAAVTNEVEEEDRDRIPGPVCKVKPQLQGCACGVSFVTRLSATNVTAAKAFLHHELRDPLDWTGQCVC